MLGARSFPLRKGLSGNRLTTSWIVCWGSIQTLNARNPSAKCGRWCMSNAQRLYFTIGPVQPFVEASRRTRDLWTSSFLLSHLADAAIQGAEGAGAKIVLPHRERRDAQRRTDNDHGGVPNRF